MLASTVSSKLLKKMAEKEGFNFIVSKKKKVESISFKIRYDRIKHELKRFSKECLGNVQYIV